MPEWSKQLEQAKIRNLKALGARKTSTHVQLLYTQAEKQTRVFQHYPRKGLQAMPKRNFKELLCTFAGMKCVESLPADCFYLSDSNATVSISYALLVLPSLYWLFISVTSYLNVTSMELLQPTFAGSYQTVSKYIVYAIVLYLELAVSWSDYFPS